MIDLRDCEPVELMPEALRDDAQIKAMSYALRETARMLLEKIDPVTVYAGVDILPEQIVDLLAVEFRAQYYDTSLPVLEKRKAVKKSAALALQGGNRVCCQGIDRFGVEKRLRAGAGMV